MLLTLIGLAHSLLRQPASQAEQQSLDLLLKLLRVSGNLQSEPTEYTESYRAAVAEISGTTLLQELLIVGEQPLPAHVLAKYSYAAMLLEQLVEGWDAFYKPVFSIHPDLERATNALITQLRAIPFAQALGRLEEQWEAAPGATPLNVAALMLVRACALLGIFRSMNLYRKLLNYLDPSAEFLVICLAGACLKLGVVASRIEATAFEERHYGCLALLDNFHYLPDTHWG
jgi:hypothetical protein